MSLPHAIQRNATGFNGAWLSIRREEVDCHILPSSARSFIKPGESLLAWKTWWNELVEGIKSNRLSPITVRNEIRARLQRYKCPFSSDPKPELAYFVRLMCFSALPREECVTSIFFHLLMEIFRPECTIELLPVESKVLTLTSDAFLPTGNPIGSNFSTLLTHLNHFTSLTASAISQGLYDPDGLAAHHVSLRWKQFAYQLAIHCIKERSPSAAEMFNFALHYLAIVETSNLDTWHCFITYYPDYMKDSLFKLLEASELSRVSGFSSQSGASSDSAQDLFNLFLSELQNLQALSLRLAILGSVPSVHSLSNLVTRLFDQLATLTFYTAGAICNVNPNLWTRLCTNITHVEIVENWCEFWLRGCESNRTFDTA